VEYLEQINELEIEA